ncbi:MAG: hypothetical protein AAF243_16980 [Cyanobacteria bacterium P01_A01_bin.137]
MTLTDEQILIASVSAFRIGDTERPWNLDSLNITSEIDIFRSDTEDGGFDAGYITETEDEIIVSFRGVAIPVLNTGLRGVIQDWQNAAERHLMLHPSMSGKVHKGFWDSILNLENKGIFDSVVQRLASGKRLVVTGYSKGGALAPLAVSRLIGGYNVDPSLLRLCFFAAPKCGDEEFVTNINTTVHSIVRYESQYDLIPHFPYDDQFLDIVAPAFPLIARKLLFARNNPNFIQYIPGSAEYQHIGQLKFVDADNQLIQTLGPNFREQRYRQLAQKIEPFTTTAAVSSSILSRHSPRFIQEAITDSTGINNSQDEIVKLSTKRKF